MDKVQIFFEVSSIPTTAKQGLIHVGNDLVSILIGALLAAPEAEQHAGMASSMAMSSCIDLVIRRARLEFWKIAVCPTRGVASL